MRKVNNKSGFTIVELSFSIVFIAILSIIVLVMISNAVSAYHRGLTLNQLNTLGMSLVDSMQSSVQSSPAKSAISDCSLIYTDSTTATACENDKALGFVFVERYANVRVGNNSPFSAPVYGAFCTGKESFAWNSGYFFNSEYKVDGVSALNIKYRVAGGSSEATASNFKLLKIQDEDRLLCKIASGYNSADTKGGVYRLSNNHSGMPNSIDVASKPIDDEPADLLAGNNNLALYDLVTALPATSGNSGNAFYASSFVLGTVQGGINVRAAGNYCAAPEDYARASTENFDYCAINKFNFAAQATGK